MSVWQILFSGQGRIRRRDFWLWSIGSFFILFAAMVIISVIYQAAGGSPEEPVPVLAYLLYIPLTWASLCLQIKRWHDRDKSGWWILINWIPLIGGIWALVENGFLDGTQGRNRYGPSPKGIGAQADVNTVFE